MPCPDHDPLIRAGHVQCHRCGRVAYPTDAAWVGALIVASFPATCEHTDPMSWVVDPDDSEEEPLPEFCGALTRSGDPCRIRTHGHGQCRHHRTSDRGRR
ncbi:hypothetical protein DFP74_5788 [Nocardiopsis sp. Huas11]|nr:hypothetical protein DFP74_5788 [Nocardiopsis sp. Huas11]